MGRSLSIMIDMPQGPDEMPGIVQKLEIGGESIYLKIGFTECRPTWVSLTLGHEVGHEGSNENRTLIEVICKQASVLLETGTWTIDDLADNWIATQNCKPSGICPQINGIAKSPLDAAAKWINQKYGLRG